VGTKICVHALPVDTVYSNQKYEGMPLFAELGPIYLDPMVSQEAERIVKETLESF
jgi:hypothetical protein